MMLSIETGNKNKILRTISKKIPKSDIKKFIKLGKKMISYLKDTKNGGVGLAAPQIWHNIRLIAVSLLKDRDDENFKTIMMFNPEIIKASEETEIDQEWCLSVPGEKGKVERYSSIKLSYQNEKWDEKTLVLNHLTARIVQHEIDHLDGILFTDKAL